MPTSFSQDIKFRNVPESNISEFNFIGGYVSDVHETKLEQNKTPNVWNVIYNDSGNIKTRDGYIRYNTDPVGSSSATSNTGTSTGTILLSNPDDEVAQTFQVGSDSDFVQANLYLAMNTSGEEQLVQTELWNGSTGPSTLISKGPIVLVSGTSETIYRFRFNIPQRLSASTEYAIVLKPFIRGSTQAIKSVKVHHTGNAYGSGAAYSSSNAGISWSAVSSTDLKFSVLTGGATGSTGLIRFYGENGIQRTIAKFGTSLYVGNDQTGAMTAANSTPVSLQTNNFIDYTVSNGTLLVSDGFNRILKYRGSTNSNYTTGTISVTNNSTTVTGSGTSWATATNAESGEYIQLPDGKWYRIASVSNNTSLIIEVPYQGSTLGSQSYVISPWGKIEGDLNRATVPNSLTRPTGRYLENHINRVWNLDGNSLKFSSLDTSISGENFNDWDTANNAGEIIIPSGNGDTGTGLYSLGDVLYVFQRRAIWGVYGNSPATFQLRNITNEVGMVDRRSLIEMDNMLIFLSDLGVYAFDGSNLKSISKGAVNNYIKSWASLVTPVATLWDNKYLLSFTVSGASYNSRAMFFDFDRGVWGRVDNLFASAFSQWTGGTDNNEIYFASSNQGSIYRWGIGGNDAGYEIHTLYDTPSLGFSTGINDKAIKKFYIQQLSKGDYNMTVKQLSDINAVEIPSQINLSQGGFSLWDVMVWDVDSWSSEGSMQTDRIPEFQGLAKYFKFRIEQIGYDEGIEVLAIVTTARTRRLQ